MKEIKVLDAREVILVCSLPLIGDATGKGQKMPLSGEMGKSKVTNFPMAANHPSAFIGFFFFFNFQQEYLPKKKNLFFLMK